MASTQTREEIVTMISNINAAITAALNNQSYTLDSGQTRQTVTRQTLPDLRDLLADYEDKLDKCDNPGGGILKVNNSPYR